MHTCTSAYLYFTIRFTGNTGILHVCSRYVNICIHSDALFSSGFTREVSLKNLHSFQLLLLLMLSLCLFSCIQDPLNLTRFEDIGFGPDADLYDDLVIMERPYGRTLETSFETDGVKTSFSLKVMEDGKAELKVSNERGTDLLAGTWTDWATFRIVYDEWNGEEKKVAVRKDGIFLVFEGDEPCSSGIVPSSLNSRITFTYPLDSCSASVSERYTVFRPLPGAPVDFRSINSETSPLITPLWRCMD